MGRMGARVTTSGAGVQSGCWASGRGQGAHGVGRESWHSGFKSRDGEFRIGAFNRGSRSKMGLLTPQWSVRQDKRS